MRAFKLGFKKVRLEAVLILNINHIVYEDKNSYFVTGNKKVELTEESEKALIDLIDQRIDERLEESKKARQVEDQKILDEWIDYYKES